MLMLAEKEQLRLLLRLPDYLARARGEPGDPAASSLARHHAAFEAVSTRIRRFQSSLMSQSLSSADTEWLLNQQRRQEMLDATEDICHDLCETISNGIDPQARQLSAGIVEALDTMLLTAISGMENNDRGELDMLDAMTHDRGTAMESIRKKYLVSSEQLSANARSQILLITSIFERAAWSLRRFGELLRASSIMQG
jgi:phosphate:Na+ symporter